MKQADQSRCNRASCVALNQRLSLQRSMFDASIFLLAPASHWVAYDVHLYIFE